MTVIKLQSLVVFEHVNQRKYYLVKWNIHKIVEYIWWNSHKEEGEIFPQGDLFVMGISKGDCKFLFLLHVLVANIWLNLWIEFHVVLILWYVAAKWNRSKKNFICCSSRCMEGFKRIQSRKTKINLWCPNLSPFLNIENYISINTPGRLNVDQHFYMEIFCPNSSVNCSVDWARLDFSFTELRIACNCWVSLPLMIHQWWSGRRWRKVEALLFPMESFKSMR